MGSLGEDVREYNRQLRAGRIRRAYRGIMSFMAGLRDTLAAKHPDCAVGSLYQGYMDMTYFSFTPASLSGRRLKVAVVYLHEEDRLEVWLAGSNRRVQGEFVELLKGRNLGGYRLSKVAPGVDSIIEGIIAESPDFDDSGRLALVVEEGIIEFTDRMVDILREGQ